MYGESIGFQPKYCKWYFSLDKQFAICQNNIETFQERGIP